MIETIMANQYVTLIKAGRRTLESVPEKLRGLVAERLEETKTAREE